MTTAAFYFKFDCLLHQFHCEPLAWRVRHAEVIDALNVLMEAHPHLGIRKYMDRMWELHY